MLLDSNENLILIDWEQSGAPKCTVAPEADGSWDVKADPESGKLMYTRYQGPTRKNHKFGWPEWNVFPIWREECPRALEAAEVSSVGRTMWMLLT
ncbi:hypothetical protein N7G274_003966 [Stereocaulon virgatum]|uniref:Aminoglycoside phosphotransferase domain-containing protein n=1 Tax=Stereocaulon virgatum TaxID=373712 RepID=A0ABR4ADX6_9LECA